MGSFLISSLGSTLNSFLISSLDSCLILNDEDTYEGWVSNILTRELDDAPKLEKQYYLKKNSN
jgi:hypothetical protein